MTTQLLLINVPSCGGYIEAHSLPECERLALAMVEDEAMRRPARATECDRIDEGKSPSDLTWREEMALLRAHIIEAKRVS